MPLRHIAHALLCQPWGILPENHAALAEVVKRHTIAADRPATEEQLRASKPLDPILEQWRAIPAGAAVVGPRDENGNPIVPQMQRVGSTAIIPVFGTLGRHLSFLALWCGGCDFDHVEQMTAEAEADPSIASIVYYFRSPGGMVIGCQECADVIASTQKETLAYSDELCCSCAYWLACACDAVLFSPSAMVGNIGTFIAGVDDSAAWSAAGLRLELFRSGPNKATGIRGKAWTDEERAAMQARTDESFATFRDFVIARRPGVQDSAFSGAWVHGRESIGLGLADALAPSLAAAVAVL